MTNGRLILVIGGAAFGGLLVGGVISGANNGRGLDLILQAKPTSSASKQQLPRRGPSASEPQRARASKTDRTRDSKPKRPSSKRPSPTTRHRIEIHADDATRGPASARVTIVSFTDFQCPYCGRAAKTMAHVHEAYGDQVRIVFKHHPLSFHRDAHLAHQAAAEAQAQGKFWEYHDRLFSSRTLKRPDLEAHAEALGLDMARFRQALDNQTHAPHINRDIAQARGLGATGTPAFFLNGRFISGARPFEAFQQLIDGELGR